MNWSRSIISKTDITNFYFSHLRDWWDCTETLMRLYWYTDETVLTRWGDWTEYSSFCEMRDKHRYRLHLLGCGNSQYRLRCKPWRRPLGGTPSVFSSVISWQGVPLHEETLQRCAPSFNLRYYVTIQSVNRRTLNIVNFNSELQISMKAMELKCSIGYVQGANDGLCNSYI